jgi:predicted S18 family serine protease
MPRSEGLIVAKLEEAKIEELWIFVKEHLANEDFITNRRIRQKTGISYDEAISFFNRMIDVNRLVRLGKGVNTHYVLVDQNR